jgi:peptidoglycan/xylan/chitin deacetylase (PgdA/CDA1 family)
LVLLYHRVGPPGVDPWRLAVSPEHFAEHLDLLVRSCTILTAPDLGRALDAGRIPARAVVITFDDGYADLVLEVQPRLARTGARATAFLVSRAINRYREFWWDQVERALLGSGAPTEALRLNVAGKSMTLDPSAHVSPLSLHRQVWALLRRQPPAERDRLAESLLAWTGVTAAPRSTHRTLTSGELDRVARDDRFEIGAHTADHAWLAGLGPDAASAQVESGMTELEELIGRPIEAFAYPHGGTDDIGDGANAVRSAGFRQAFMAVPGTVRHGADRLRLPRLFVEDIDGEGLGRLLWHHAGIRVA